MLGAFLAYAYGKRRANRQANEYYYALEQALIDYDLAQQQDKQLLLDIIEILLEEDN